MTLFASATVLAAATVAMRALVARRVLRVVVRPAIGQRQNFAADVADDFDLLLHQAFDRQDFLAFRGITKRDRDAAVALAGGTADAVT